jgi:hypothetical protein
MRKRAGFVVSGKFIPGIGGRESPELCEGKGVTSLAASSYPVLPSGPNQFPPVRKTMGV